MPVGLYTLATESFAEYTAPDGSKYFLCFVKSSLLPSNIPLDANLRYPKKNGKTFQDIYKTLISEPENFLGSNLGMRIVASKCTVVESNKLKLTIKPGQGVSNGAHTYFAILSSLKEGADLSDVPVIVVVHVGLLQAELPKLCSRLNTGAKVDRRSIQFKTGAYDELRSKLEKAGYHFVTYFQNQEFSLSNPNLKVSQDARCNISHAVCLLDSINSERWAPTLHPIRHATQSAHLSGLAIDQASLNFDKCFSGVFDAEKKVYIAAYEYLKRNPQNPLADIVLPTKVSSKTLQKCVHLLDGTVVELFAPKGFALPVVAALRAFHDSEDNEWEYPLEGFIDNLISLLWSSYQGLLTRAFQNRQSLRTVLENSSTWLTLFHCALTFKSSFLKKSNRLANYSKI
jgi:hypothetical protein